MHLNLSNGKPPTQLSGLPLFTVYDRFVTLVSARNNLSDGVTSPGVISEVHCSIIYTQPIFKYDAFVDVTRWVTLSWWTLDEGSAGLPFDFRLKL